MTEIRQHDLTKDCWCEPTVFPVSGDRPEWVRHHWQLPEMLECVGEGWHEIVMWAHKEISKLRPDYECAQLKEKFGGLRIYLDSEPEDVSMVIREAEEKAHYTCEFCGADAPGPRTPEGRKYGWIKTTCDACHAGRG